MKRDFDSKILDPRGKPYGMPDKARSELEAVRDALRAMVANGATADQLSALVEGLGRAIDASDDMRDMTLADVAFDSLGQVMAGDERLSGSEKRAMRRLNEKVSSGGEVDLTAEEFTLLTKRIGQVMHPMFAGAALDLLDETGEAPPPPVRLVTPPQSRPQRKPR